MKELIRKSRLMLLLATFLLSAGICSAQTNIKATGNVSDEDGEPLIGVAVKSQDGKRSTITDIDGNYTIVLPAATTLHFSLVGMEETNVKVDRSGTYNVVMKTAENVLDDVVVVGYGTQKKINLTGAVQSVSAQEILRSSLSKGSSVLQGIVPGLTAIQGSGQPGNDQASLRLRGVGSLNSTESPLVLIDGVEGDFNRIDLNQVESISVLKDGASASIYGSRASNGVILVTTKRGTNGKAKVTFNGYVGWNKPTTMPESVDAVGYLTVIDQARINNDQPALYGDIIEKYRTEGADNMTLYDTNWRDLIMKKSAFTQNYSVSVSGGSDMAKVYASAGYFKQEGMVPNNTFERTNLRLNSDLKVNRWLNLGADISIRQSVVNNPIGSATDLIGYAMTFTPTLSAINADGTWGYGLQGNNPIAAINDGGYSKSVAPEYNAKLSFTLRPFDGLDIVGYYTWKRNDGKTNAFADTYDLYEGGVFKESKPAVKAGSEERSTTVLKQYNLLATYEKTFAQKHYLKLMAGMQSEECNFSSLTAKRTGYYYDGYEDINNGDPTTATNGSYRYSWSMLAYVFRINYIFNNRYLIELNGRYDGTSRFLADKRWGFFPSASVGWRISEENFWESLRSTVDNLKLRASIGKLGNQNIGSYFPYVSAISADSAQNNYGYWFNKALAAGVAQTQLANPLIGWEKSNQTDVGLDVSMFNSRLTATFDYYYRRIDDMLQQFPVPEFIHLTSPWINAGSMRNQGWELSIGWNDKVGNVNYYVKGNLSDVRNKILDLYGNKYLSGGTITTEGYPRSSYYGYVAEGYFNSIEEINAVDDEGKYIYAVPGDRVNVKPGFIRYKDVNGDGKINDDDRQIIGEHRPHFNFGLQFGLDWKGIDFSGLIQGVGQNDVFYSGGGAKPLVGNATIYKNQLDTWTPENTNAKYPLLLQDPNGSLENNKISSFWIKSGAYARLKNITLGYTLPKKWTKAAAIERVRFYATAQNLLTVRGSNFYEGFDPETSAGASCYPLNKTFLFGVNLDF